MGYPSLPPDTRTTHQTRVAWGHITGNQRAVTHTFTNQTQTTIHPLATVAVDWLDQITTKHGYPVDTAIGHEHRLTTNTDREEWSLHAYGIAIDINPDRNQTGPNLTTDMPPELVNEIVGLRHHETGSRVWQWGGSWGHVSPGALHEPAHFQLALTKPEAETLQAAPTGLGLPVPPIGDRVTALEDQLVMHAARLEVLGDIVAGADDATLAEWMARAALKGEPSSVEVAWVLGRLRDGGWPEDVLVEARSRLPMP